MVDGGEVGYYSRRYVRRELAGAGSRGFCVYSGMELCG